MTLSLAIPALGFISALRLLTDSAPFFTLQYGTYLGGCTKDDVNAIAVDPDGNAYVGGQTLSPDFPSTRDAFLTKSGVAGDDYAGFVSKLNRDGKLVFSTFLRGSPGRPFLRTFVNAVAVDRDGNRMLPARHARRTFLQLQKLFSNGRQERVRTSLNRAMRS